jgi:hypothetical protein
MYFLGIFSEKGSFIVNGLDKYEEDLYTGRLSLCLWKRRWESTLIVGGTTDVFFAKTFFLESSSKTSYTFEVKLMSCRDITS